MSLSFFSDQCVPTEIIESIRRQGHRITRLHEVMPDNSPDPKVIQKSHESGAILLSLNGDFADIVAYPPKNYSGIIAIQLHNHPEVIPQMLRLLLRFLEENPQQDFYKGKLFIVEPHRIRIR